jgi:hypothetical protein
MYWMVKVILASAILCPYVLMAQPAGTPEIDSTDPFRFVIDDEPWYPAGYYPALGALTIRWDEVALATYYQALIDKQAANGINYCRMVFSMGEGVDWGNIPQTIPYTAVGTVTKSGYDFAKVDLNTFDQDHFDYWYDVINYAKGKGVVVQLCILDSWHVRNVEAPWWGLEHDFYASGMNDDGLAISTANDWHTTNTGSAVWQRHTAMIEEVVDELGGLPNIIWEVSNEPRRYYDSNNYSDIINNEASSITDWTVKLGNHLKSYEYSTRSYNHICMPNDLHDHQKTPGQRYNWRVGYSDCHTPSGVHRDLLYILGLSDSRFPDRPMISDNDGNGDVVVNDRRKKAWACLTAGAHIDYFDFDLRSYSEISTQDVGDSMKYIGYTSTFVDALGVELAGMDASDSLVTSGWCYAGSGEEYVVYLTSGGNTTVSNLPSEYTARWFNPRNGTVQAASGGPTFSAPDSNDWVLHIVDKAPVDISDTFTGVTAGNAVNNRVTEVGNKTWSCNTNSVFGPGCITTQSSTGSAVGGIPFDPDDYNGDPICTVSGDVNPYGSSWNAIGFNLSASGGYWSHGQVWILLRPAGTYVIHSDGTNYPLGSGSIPSYVSDTYNNVLVQYDPSNNKAAVWLNGTQVLSPTTLSFTPDIQYAGFHNYKGTQDSSNIDNFEVNAEDVDPPTITSHPSNQTVDEGQTAQFTVAATGEGTLTYQWQKGTTNLSNGGDISGATSTTLSIANCEEADEGNYRCVVSNDGGSTNSNYASLTVNTSGQSPFNGSPFAITDSGNTTIEAEDFDLGGEGVAYHDTTVDNLDGSTYRNSADPGCRVDIKYKTSASNNNYISYPAVNEWLEYTVDVQDAGDYDIHVYTAATNSGKKLKVEIGSLNQTLTLIDTDSWNVFAANTIEDVSLSAGQQILKITDVTAGFNFDYIVFEPVTIAPPTITQHPSNQTVDEGQTAQFTVAATGSGTLSYQWQKGTTNLSNGGDISGATSTTLSIANCEEADEGNYRCVVTNEGGSTNSNYASLTVNVSGQSPFNGSPLAITNTGTATLEAEDFDLGGEDEAYHDTTVDNIDGSTYRDSADPDCRVDIKYKTSSSNNNHVTYPAVNEWLEYSVDVEDAGTYDIKVYAACTNSGKKVKVEIGSFSQTITLTVSGGWNTFVANTIQDVSLSAGEQIFKITDVTAGFNLDKYTFVP